jgi:dTDP-4-dehydrorhamnose reductase
MASKRILITGGGGLLGQYLNEQFALQHDILTLYRNHPGNCLKFPHRQGDINNTDFLKKLFDEFHPDVVIHTAAVSNPTQADKLDTATVFKTNVEATHELALLCKEHNAKIFFTSTDLVYAGYRGSLLKEDAKLIPISLYAETKLMGEKKIQQSGADHIIFRTALLFGAGKNQASCFFEEMIRTLQQGKTVRLFHDQFRSTLSLREAARIIAEVVEKSITNDIINLAGPERTSRVEVGEMVCELGGFDTSLIQQISLRDIPSVPFVEDVSMDISKLLALGITQPPLRDTIQKELDVIIHKM